MPDYSCKDFEEWKDFAVGACRGCAYVASSYQLELREKTVSGSDFAVSHKTGFTDVVTEADRAIEDRLRGAIEEKFPTHAFIGEESHKEKIMLAEVLKPVWIVDPIDGTMNYVHGFPGFCISIGVIYRNKPVVGVVYNVSTDQLYSAVTTKGAFCNGVKIHASSCCSLDRALISIELALVRDKTWRVDATDTLANFLHNNVAAVRMTGSSVLSFCQVAQGSVDGFFVAGCHLWDVAAAAVILKESGAVLLDPLNLEEPRLTGRKFLACSCLELAQKLQPLILSSTEFPED